MASWGVPALLSVVYPSVPPPDVDDRVLTRLARTVAAVPAFDCVFSRTDWFGDDVLCLARDPYSPFVVLVRAVVAEFPAHLPYGGIYDEPRVDRAVLLAGRPERDSWRPVADFALA
jgi:hypothetical protein